MKFLKTLGLMALAAVMAFPVSAQTGAVTPVYIPAQILGATTLAAPGSATFNTNGDGSIYFRIAGTFTGLVATIQGTESRAASPAWSNIGASQSGGARITRITAAGLYRASVSGFAQARLNITAIASGSAVVTASAGPGVELVGTLGATRQTYSAVISALAPAASATDFITITGSATYTVRVVEAGCDGTATAVGTAKVIGLVRSTANTAGTSAAVTATPNDSLNQAATATVLSYTANPTTGTLVGNTHIATMQLTPTATTTFGAVPLLFSYATAAHGLQEIVLRGITQVYALNGNGASFPAGTALNCHITWTEE